MRARATRRISVTNSATQIRDTTAPPVTYSIIRYASGGADIEIGRASNLTFGSGETVQPDTDFVLKDQSLLFYAVGSAAGPTTLEVTDYEA